MERRVRVDLRGPAARGSRAALTAYQGSHRTLNRTMRHQAPGHVFEADWRATSPELPLPIARSELRPPPAGMASRAARHRREARPFMRPPLSLAESRLHLLPNLG